MPAELPRKLAQEALSVEVVRQDVTKLDLETRFALAFVAFNSFEESSEDDDGHLLLQRIFKHLRSGQRAGLSPALRLRQAARG